MKRKNMITVGTFDGVHIGHQHLFARLDTLAAQHLLKPLVLYFPLPPKTLLNEHPEMTILTTPEEKKKLFRQHAMPAHTLDFEAIRTQSAEDFFTYLQTEYNLGGLLIGADFAFAKDRQGDAAFLRTACKRADIPCEIMPFFNEDNTKISSSLIRKTLAQGDISRTTALLGRPYELTGKVIKGFQLGRKLGFPTANLDTGLYKILPLGVFAVKVRVGTKIYNGFCNIGFRPTVNTLHTRMPLVEVNIFKFKQSIYGRKITIWFVEKLRNEMKFTSLEKLTAQLAADKKHAEKLLR